jgi:hypothetical protein
MALVKSKALIALSAAFLYGGYLVARQTAGDIATVEWPVLAIRLLSSVLTMWLVFALLTGRKIAIKIFVVLATQGLLSLPVVWEYIPTTHRLGPVGLFLVAVIMYAIYGAIIWWKRDRLTEPTLEPSHA